MMNNRPLRDLLFPEFSGGGYDAFGTSDAFGGRGGRLGEPTYQGRTADESSPPGWIPNPSAWDPFSNKREYPGGDPFYSALNAAARQTQEPWLQTQRREVPNLFTRDRLLRDEIFGPDTGSNGTWPYLVASNKWVVLEPGIYEIGGKWYVVSVSDGDGSISVKPLIPAEPEYVTVTAQPDPPPAPIEPPPSSPSADPTNFEGGLPSSSNTSIGGSAAPGARSSGAAGGSLLEWLYNDSKGLLWYQPRSGDLIKESGPVDTGSILRNYATNTWISLSNLVASALNVGFDIIKTDADNRSYIGKYIEPSFPIQAIPVEALAFETGPAIEYSAAQLSIWWSKFSTNPRVLNAALTPIFGTLAADPLPTLGPATRGSLAGEIPASMPHEYPPAALAAEKHFSITSRAREISDLEKAINDEEATIEVAADWVEQVANAGGRRTPLEVIKELKRIANNNTNPDQGLAQQLLELFPERARELPRLYRRLEKELRIRDRRQIEEALQQIEEARLGRLYRRWGLYE